MAQRPKAKPKRKGVNVTNKAQSERFKKTARELGVDESGGVLERAFRKIVGTRKGA